MSKISAITTKIIQNQQNPNTKSSNTRAFQCQKPDIVDFSKKKYKGKNLNFGAQANCNNLFKFLTVCTAFTMSLVNPISNRKNKDNTACLTGNQQSEPEHNNTNENRERENENGNKINFRVISIDKQQPVIQTQNIIQTQPKTDEDKKVIEDNIEIFKSICEDRDLADAIINHEFRIKKFRGKIFNNPQLLNEFVNFLKSCQDSEYGQDEKLWDICYTLEEITEATKGNLKENHLELFKIFKNQQNKYEYSDSTICTVLREDIDKESYPFLNHLLKIDTNSYFNNNNNINSLIEILKGIGNNAYIRDTVIKKAKEWSNLNYYKVDILESIVETLNKYPQIIGFFQKYNFKGCYEHLSDIDLILNGEKKEGKESYPLTEEQTAFFAELLKYNPNIYDSGLKIHNAIKNFKPENYQKAIKYTKFFKFEKLNELLNNIDKNTISDLMIFLIDDSYDKEIEKHSAGKYQKELIKILNIDNLTNCNNNMDKIYKYPSPLELLCKSRLSKEDFLNGIRKLSRYTFKLLYEKPNQYLSGIDIKYSTPIDNKFPELPTYELNREREKIIKFLCNNLPEILTAFKYVDADTINHMLDRRTDLFEVQIKQLNELTEDNFEILSKALVCKSVTNNKPLSPKEKIQLCQIVEIFQRAKIDMSPIIKATESGKIDLNSIKLIIQHKILKKAGINPNNHMLKNKKLFNEEYSYLALIDKSSEILRNIDNLFEEKFKITINQIRGNIVRKENIIKCYEDILNNLQLLGNISDNAIMILNELVHMLKNIDKYSDKEILQKMYESIELSINANAERNNLYTCIRESIIGDFKEFITNPSNKYGQANMRTKQAFEKEGLNYDKWLSPEITDLQFEVAGKKMTIKMWDRNPQEDLFIGNKTTCCTAIGTGGNSAATPLYLLNTAYNVVELYDSKDNVVGMSRVFMGKMEDKPVLLMDNIELNKTFIKNMNTEQLQEIRDNFFSYMNQYAQQITGNSETEVYFYSRDLRVPVNDLKQTNRTTHFIGSLSQEEIYVNAARCRWINPTRLNEIGEIPWLKVPNVN